MKKQRLHLGLELNRTETVHVYEHGESGPVRCGTPVFLIALRASIGGSLCSACAATMTPDEVSALPLVN